MINLLADDRKSEIRAARTNIILLRYMGIITLAFAFIAGAMYLSYSLLQSTMQSAEALVTANDVKADVYSDTKQQVDELGLKLKDAKAIADNEIRYSQVLIKIGQVMPAGTVLGDITLESANFNGTPLEITAYAKSAAEASQLQSALQTSPLFSTVSLTSTEAGKGVDGYPVLVSLTASLNKAGI